MSLDVPRTEALAVRLTAHEALQRLEHERATRLTQLRAIDEAGPEAEEQMMSTQKEAVLRVLTDIEAAVARVQDGSYGLCRKCTQAIPVERLEILPYTPFCVPCLRGVA
ncbi:molecular chaperone DnaK [Streptomyces longisporoflavus]|uniref:TraR/DksA family transcriptional regulator n=1 Tax=Streptomyces longisporoflavus TaxID=28044 RepID=UPI00167ED7EC|nr:TraR/DksA C4-type zinc finger protein [Streptomyces longisporoflavus]GGV27430.1 molecular chaperone DnaK [Streptomyces longisporoflavus]